MEEKRNYFRRRSDYFLFKSIYIMFFSIIILIAAFFYSQYKISIVESNQKQALQLFKMYSEKDLHQQCLIDDLRKHLDVLNKKTDECYEKFNKKLDDILKIVLSGKCKQVNNELKARNI